MKKKSLLAGISLIILASILLCSLLVVRPVLSACGKAFERMRERYVVLIREYTGLDISYRSLSPSILSGIRMADVRVSDIESGSPVLTVNSVKLRWNILKLLGKDPVQALGELVVSGIKADYNDLSQYALREKLQVLGKAVKNDTYKAEHRDSVQSFAAALYTTPIRVRVKNALFSYTDAFIKNELHISDARIQRSKQTNYFNWEISGKNSVRLLKNNSALSGNLAASFSVQASITPSLQNSFAQIRFFTLRESDYAVPAVNMYASYEGTSLHASIMQNKLPFSLNLNADTNTQNLTLEFKAENFDFLSAFKIKTASTPLNAFSSSSLSGAYTLSWDWAQKSASYSVDGSVKFASKTKENAEAFYRFSGTSEKVNFDSVQVRSSAVSADYSGSFDIRNLRPQGNAFIHSLKLPNGNELSAELYMESSGNESLFFIPQLYFGQNSLTALQLRVFGDGQSRDFSFEAYDYAKSDIAGAGAVRADGSITLGEQKYMQLQLSSENLFLDSAAGIISWCLPEAQRLALNGAVPALAPYIFSFDLFFSTDFKSITYNTPYAVIANTKKNGELLLFAVDGTESVFQLSRFDMLAGGQSVQMQANADIDAAGSEVFFGLSLFINSLPYSFSGVYIPGRYVNVSGDYGFNAAFYFDQAGGFTGSLSAQSVPLVLSKLHFSLSTSLQCVYSSPDNWNAQIERLDIGETSKTLAVVPQISLKGSADPLGVYFNYARYSDELSSLDGNLNLLWTWQKGIPEAFTLNAAFSDRFSSEKYDFIIQAHNPDRFAANDPDFLKNVYFSAEAEIEHMPSGRFVRLQKEKNVISGSLTALGTLADPSAQLNLREASFSSGHSEIKLSGSAAVEDKNLVFTDFDVNGTTFNLNSMSGSFSLAQMSGSLEGSLSGKVSDEIYFDKKTFSGPFTVTLTPLKDNAGIPVKQKEFKAELLIARLESSFFTTMNDYRIQAVRTNGRFDITAGTHAELSGFVLDDGELSFHAAKGFPVLFDAYGIVDKGEITVVFENMYAEGKTFAGLLDLPVFSLYDGTATGQATLSGTLANPLIDAEFQGDSILVGVPDYIDEKMLCKDFRVKTVHSVFSAADSLFTGDKSGAKVNLTVDLTLEKLLFSSVVLKAKTLGSSRVKGKYVMPHGIFTGTAQADIFLQANRDTVEVSGDIAVQDLEAVVSLSPEFAEEVQMDTDAIVDLTVTTDTKSRLFIPKKDNPIVRGLVTQTNPLKIQMDTRYGTSSFTGSFAMKGGEILYLNRTFFIKEADAVLNENVDSFDPRLNARAEIRERDKDGNPVRIELSVADQPLSRLNPAFTSVPAKTQQEILTLLGQIFLADAANTNALALLGSLADYGAQVTVFRHVENRLRDLFKFDIFSLRTMFLQNAFISALKSESGTSKMTAGNFLDNTTVYIGKYLGDTLYADAMLHLTYNENLAKKDTQTGGLVFQPEIGLELPSPFALIRWSIAPDLNSDWNNLLVPYTSISLSWKFNF
ncbi:translocation/assembly module TamB domain-containing protein [Treponema lecithinolyticum]|uniref:translocation/assembly module TamB domain-containing protein n=1 Tax=Treponema lecithinolyticum TaxID=53418 RepID=UPI0028EFE067|nr:translocation/assembly module TamB domain-containing protein [Treponema lecithinolyticum]